jgi:hypothetical protein
LSIHFATPLAALIALAVVIPLTGWLRVSRRATRVRASLGLPELSRGRHLAPVAAVVVLAGLLGVAAAQPAYQKGTALRVRSDAQLFIVIDSSRSMLASAKLGSPSRIDRAKATAARLERSLRDVPVGIATITNRVLPHLFPTTDSVVFQATLADAVGVDKPPPGSSAFSTTRSRTASTLDSLTQLASRRFYAPGARHRLAIVLTDGESRPISASSIARSLQDAHIQTIYVQFWGSKDQVFTKGQPEKNYRPNPNAQAILERLAEITGGDVYREGDSGAVTQDVHRLLGTGPTTVSTGERAQPVALAPYVAGVAFLPLTLLLWRRSR